MLCDKCLNRNICKYYAFFADAPMEITIESCEKFVTKQKASSNVEDIHYPKQMLFKEPIDYSQFETNEKITLLENDEEERITVDLSEEHTSKVTSITDLLLGDDK